LERNEVQTQKLIPSRTSEQRKDFVAAICLRAGDRTQTKRYQENIPGMDHTRRRTRVFVPGACSLMVVRRNVYLAWLALTLNALAPVLAYAHIHLGAHGEIIEHCAADEPGDTDEHDHHLHVGKGTVAHCLYCPGFAAGVSLARVDWGPILRGDVSAPPVRPAHAMPFGRSSVRIAQQRAPPSIS
jgi:hypothetical protein